MIQMINQHRKSVLFFACQQESEATEPQAYARRVICVPAHKGMVDARLQMDGKFRRSCLYNNIYIEEARTNVLRAPHSRKLHMSIQML
jgi:hypothetical protein